jgi:clan AA aspartic protease (TIGR02281 family)
MPQAERRGRPAVWAAVGLLAASMALTECLGDEPTPGDEGQERLVSMLANLDQAQRRYQEVLGRQTALEDQWQAASHQPSNPPPPPRSPGFNPPGFDPPPGPGFDRPPPIFDRGPPGAMKKFGAPPREDWQRPLRRQYATLQAERVLLEAQIVRAEFAAEDLAARLDVKRRSPGAPPSDAKELVEKQRSRLELKGTSRARGLAGAAESVLDELGIALGRLQAIERDADARRKMLEKASTEKQRAEQVQVEARAREALDALAGVREEFLRIVAALAEALRAATPADDSRARQEILMTAPGEKGAPVPSTEQLARRLRELQRLIRTETVAIDRDRSIVWVEATLNGSSGQTMIVDLGGAETRLSARAAAEAGVKPASERDEPAVAIATADGRTIPARRARLASLQVGPLAVQDVECLVLPEDYGAAPSILGSSFLKRFAANVDDSSATLVLTQVQAKPITRTGKSSTARPSGPAKVKRPAP